MAVRIDFVALFGFGRATSLELSQLLPSGLKASIFDETSKGNKELSCIWPDFVRENWSNINGSGNKQTDETDKQI